MSEAQRRWRSKLRQSGRREVLVTLAAPEIATLTALADESGRTISAEASAVLTEALQNINPRRPDPTG